MIDRRQFCTGAAGFAGTLLVSNRSRAQSAAIPGRLLFVRSGDIWLLSDGKEEPLIRDGAAADPRWSPEGNRVLYVRNGNSFSDLYIRSLVDNSDFQLTFNQPLEFDPGSKDYAENSVWAIDPAWAKTGLIAYASDFYTPYGRLCLWIIDGPGNPPLLALGANIDQGVENIALSADGSIAAFTSRYADEETAEYVSYVGLQDIATGETFSLIDDPAGSFFPSFDPDGSRVAAAIRDASGTDIWIVERNGGDRLRVTENAQAINPCFSSDGRWIAYFRMVNYAFELWASPVNGQQIGAPVKLLAYDDLDPSSGVSWLI